MAGVDVICGRGLQFPPSVRQDCGRALLLAKTQEPLTPLHTPSHTIHNFAVSSKPPMTMDIDLDYQPHVSNMNKGHYVYKAQPKAGPMLHKCCCKVKQNQEQNSLNLGPPISKTL